MLQKYKMLLIGTGKGDITAFVKGAGLLGYGLPHHYALEVETPVYARAFIFEQLDNSQKVCFVNCELGFITPSLKQGVLDYLTKNHPELQYNTSNLLLSAQHTHCGPSGFSYHVIYNTATPGFHIGIYTKIVNGITQRPIEGTSMLYSFDQANAPEKHTTQYFEMFGKRKVIPTA